MLYIFLENLVFSGLRLTKRVAMEQSDTQRGTDLEIAKMLKRAGTDLLPTPARSSRLLGHLTYVSTFFACLISIAADTNALVISLLG